MRYMKIRPVKIEGDIAFVDLTQGFTAKIDKIDCDLVGRYNWRAFKTRGHVYACTTDKKTRATVLMHRLIMGAPKTKLVDHIDNFGLNNTRSNLRLADYSQNMSNSKMRKDNTSGFKGVWWSNQSNKWCAEIWKNRKKHYLGLFENPEDAHLAYASASKDIFEEFSNPAGQR